MWDVRSVAVTISSASLVSGYIYIFLIESKKFDSQFASRYMLKMY